MKHRQIAETLDTIKELLIDGIFQILAQQPKDQDGGAIYVGGQGGRWVGSIKYLYPEGQIHYSSPHTNYNIYPDDIADCPIEDLQILFNFLVEREQRHGRNTPKVPQCNTTAND